MRAIFKAKYSKAKLSERVEKTPYVPLAYSAAGVGRSGPAVGCYKLAAA